MEPAREDMGVRDGAHMWVRRSGAVETYLVAASAPGTPVADAAGDAYRQIASVLRSDGLEIVQERIFGGLEAEVSILAARRDALEARGIAYDTPFTFIGGRPIGGEGLAGVIIRAVRIASLPRPVWNVMDGGRAVGRAWEHAGQTQIILQGISGCDEESGKKVSPARQTTRLIQRAERLLREQGAAYGDVVRTWFYLDDILSWYDAFNTARSAEYQRLGLLPIEPGEPLKLPASTGIGVRLPRGLSASLDLFAIVGPEGSSPRVEQLRSPVQRDAFEYGSAFSRGAIVRGKAGTGVQISGTAAIDESGRSLHCGDAAAQIRCTLDKIAVLLDPVGGMLHDVSAAVVFLKRNDDYPVWREIATRRGLDDVPCICVQADVCRDELLFEMDAEISLPHERDA